MYVSLIHVAANSTILLYSKYQNDFMKKSEQVLGEHVSLFQAITESS